mgnify:CR=1 FL=1
MIGRLTGILAEKNPPQIVLDVNGVGYELDVPMSTFYNLPAAGEKTKLLTHFAVREDGHFLYGFLTEAERFAFRQLLKVSGIGARTALSVLSGMSVNDLSAAVAQQELGRLIKIPGIGKKTASQIVLDLRGKMGNYVAENLFTEDEPVKSVFPALEDALLALGALGYSQKEVDRIKPKLKKLPEMSADEYIKQGLGFLLKK